MEFVLIAQELGAQNGNHNPEGWVHAQHVGSSLMQESSVNLQNPICLFKDVHYSAYNYSVDNYSVYFTT